MTLSSRLNAQYWIFLVQHLVTHKCTTTTGGAALAVEFVNLLSFEACSDISCTCALLFFVFWIVWYYFLSFGMCSDLRRTMCTTFSPLLAKLCVFSQILAALVFYRHYSALLFYSAAASVKDCFSWVRQPFSVHLRQYQYRHHQHQSNFSFSSSITFLLLDLWTSLFQQQSLSFI